MKDINFVINIYRLIIVVESQLQKKVVTTIFLKFHAIIFLLPFLFPRATMNYNLLETYEIIKVIFPSVSSIRNHT